MTIEDLTGRISSVEERAKSNTHRIDAVEVRMSKAEDKVESVSVIAAEITHIKDDVSDMKSDVKEMMSKSGKRWEMAVEKVIIAIISAVVGFLLVKSGLS